MVTWKGSIIGDGVMQSLRRSCRAGILTGQQGIRRQLRRSSELSSQALEFYRWKPAWAALNSALSAA
jgi:hypothetical protein